MHTFVVLAYKESKFLEECVKSVLNQTVKTNVVIATSTPNAFINNISKRYNLKVIVNKEQKGIGYDFNFAYNSSKTELVTLAHQDDIYESNYVEEILKQYNKYKNTIILSTDYYEIKNGKKEETNKLLKIKRFLLLPLYFKKLSALKINKRSVLAFGNAICCPSVTFVKKNCTSDVFLCDMKCNVDWFTWEKLSLLNGHFIYIQKKLMGHRIHNESTTTQIINDNKRIIEDKIMYNKFWPKWFTKILSKYYKNAEKCNK